jgi:hypothetical protein
MVAADEVKVFVKNIAFNITRIPASGRSTLWHHPGARKKCSLDGFYVMQIDVLT